MMLRFQYWEDRLLRAKALGLNTIQTYIPWNLHEPQPGNFTFSGIADIVSFIQLCQKLDFLVLLRAGPYICAGTLSLSLIFIQTFILVREKERLFFLVTPEYFVHILGNSFNLFFPLSAGSAF